MYRFAPDLDPKTPDILTSVNGLVPTNRGGYRSIHGADTTGAWNASAMGVGTNNLLPYNGSFMSVNTAGASRVFVCLNTATLGKIWEISPATTATDRSRGGSYTKNLPFSFCQFGDTVIASNKTDAMQSATTGAFSDLSGAIKAKIVVSDARQVVALNYNDGSDVPDGWATCDVGNINQWTPSTTAMGNEAKRGRLEDNGGPIIAGCNGPGGGVMAFKKSSIYIGRYSGLPKVRTWQTVSEYIGCISQEACINANGVVYFVGNDVYRYDGSGPPQSITAGMTQYLRTEFSRYSTTRAVLQHDSLNNLLYVFLESAANPNTFDSCFVFNILTGAWGLNRFIGGNGYCGCLIANRQQAYAWSPTFADNGSTLNSEVYLFVANAQNAATQCLALEVMRTSIPDVSTGLTPISWTCNYEGNSHQTTSVQSVTPNFIEAPDPVGAFSLTLIATKNSVYGATTQNITRALSAAYKFDLKSEGHWHRATYSVERDTGDLAAGFEWLGHEGLVVKEGRR